jgi:hypothetical protein
MVTLPRGRLGQIPRRQDHLLPLSWAIEEVSRCRLSLQIDQAGSRLLQQMGQRLHRF